MTEALLIHDNADHAVDVLVLADGADEDGVALVIRRADGAEYDLFLPPKLALEVAAGLAIAVANCGILELGKEALDAA